MRFIPTYCDACSISTLTAATHIRAGHSECPECGGEARTVPGSSYHRADRALYDLLVDALAGAALAPTDALQLLAQVDVTTLDVAPGRTTRLIASALPLLADLEARFVEDGVDVRKAEGMLVTLLSAHATARRKSGVMPALGLGEPRKASWIRRKSASSM